MRAKKIFGVERATVVSQTFHLPKAMDDVLTRSDPQYLGPKEAGVQQALAAQ